MVREQLADFFGFDEHGTDLETEVLAGLTTFLTMSYIVLVNPAILSNAITPEGFSQGQVIQMLAVVTILSAFVATLVMALYANRPFGQAPGLGLNAFFAFTVVLTLGVPWQTALAAVVVEGVLFILLTAVGARKYLIEAFPEPVKLSVGAGIRAFLGLIGLLLTFGLYAAGLRGAIIIGILLTTGAAYVAELVGVVPGGTLTTNIPGATYDITPLAGAFVDGLRGVEPFTFALVVFTFFSVDFFDTAGTLTGVGQAAGFLDEDGNLPEIERPLMADGVGTTVGGILGTSTVTTYIESATGVEEGGRTGMTALVVAGLFLASLAVVPLAAAIPVYASHIALVVIAVVMLGNVVEVDWDDLTSAIPAGMTVLIMPFTFNIGYGIAAGIISYPVVKTATGEWRDVGATQWGLVAAFVVYFFVQTSGILQGNF